MPSRLGFVMAMILVSAITIINVLIYPKYLEWSRSKKATNKVNLVVVPLISGVLIFVIIAMVFFLNI